MNTIKFLSYMILLLTFVACMPKSDKGINADDDNSEVIIKTIAEQARSQWNSARNEILLLRAELSAELEDIDNEITTASEEVREELTERRLELLEWKRQADDRLESLGDDLADNWEEVIADTQNYVDEIQEKLQEIDS